ncbi:MAG: hypothetical protein FWD39_01615 [Clostridiales bacterium]|nr:hypothetical protein [Clostridiales bacterium]
MKKTMIVTGVILLILLAGYSLAGYFLRGFGAGLSHFQFTNIDDFKTYVTTGSMNSKDYVNAYVMTDSEDPEGHEWKDHIPTYTTLFNNNPRLLYPFNKNSFVDIRELFPDEKLLDDFRCVRILLSNLYNYIFESGISVSFNYDKKRYKSNNIVDAINNRYKGWDTKPEYKYMSVKDIAVETATKGDVYIIDSVGDFKIAYSVYVFRDKISSASLHVTYDGFYIAIHTASILDSYDTLAELIADPVNAPIAAFFTEGEAREAAFMNLVDVIKNRQVKGGK